MIASLFTILYIVYIVLGVLFYDLHYCSYIDEIYPWLLLSVLLFSRRKFSKPLAVWLCIALFYLLYSFTIVSNTDEAILSDFIAETKPYTAFLALLCLRPRLSRRQLNLLRRFCLLCIPILIVAGIMNFGKVGTERFTLLPGARLGSACTILALSYYLFANKDSKKTMITCLLICAIGFAVPTSKHIILTGFIFFLFFSTRHHRLRFGVLALMLCAWVANIIYDSVINDFTIYYQSEGSARSELFKSSWDILNDYFPFGSGLATYANAASANWYSPLYGKYGLDSVYGLVEGNTLFASDTYIPVLAQFGWFGVIMFIVFIRFIYKKAKAYYRYSRDVKSYKIALTALAYIFIESMADASIIGNRGVAVMMILALSLYNIRINEGIADKQFPLPERR